MAHQSQPSSLSPSPSPQSALLPNELWIRSFSYLDETDLFRLAVTNRNFLSMSSSDSLWENHCRRLWRGKVNVRRFYKKDTTATSMHIVRGDEDGNTSNDGRVPFCIELTQQFQNNNNHHPPPNNNHNNELPPINMGGSTIHHTPTSWKESYILSLLDSRRRLLSRSELVHYQWKLIYDGVPSRMGLRKFNANGQYWSPYMGMCDWVLNEREGYLMFAGISLWVERDDDNWGWIIGKGTRTEYRCVEVEE